MNIRYSRRALSQLASVFKYLQERNGSAAENVTAGIRSTIARLEEMPLLGKATDEAGMFVIMAVFRFDVGRYPRASVMT